MQDDDRRHAADGRQPLKRRLAQPGTLFATWAHSRSPEVVETIGTVGFDAVIIDLEHGEFGLDAIPDLLRAADVSGCNTLVRVSHLEPSQITRALDAGAEGVVIPNVVSAEQAALAVSAAHYPGA